VVARGGGRAVRGVARDGEVVARGGGRGGARHGGATAVSGARRGVSESESEKEKRRARIRYVLSFAECQIAGTRQRFF
jgi:hypothetical protein